MPFGSPGRKQALVTLCLTGAAFRAARAPGTIVGVAPQEAGDGLLPRVAGTVRPEIHRLNRCVTTGRDVDGPPPRISEVALVVHPPPGPTVLQTELGIRGLTPDARDHPAVGELPVVEEV